MSTTPRTNAARSRIAAVGALAVAGALVLTGCGDQTKKDSGGGSSQASGAASGALHDKLPAEIQQKGVINVGSDIAYAPVEFTDKSGKTAGMDPDIGAALGRQLGVKVNFQNGTFDSLVTGLRAKRYDMIMSAMTDTKDRQNGIEDGKKVGAGVDFVDYYSAGVSIYTQKGKTQGINGWDDLCGKTIVVERGTVSEDLSKAEAKKCPAGKKVKIESFDTDQQAQVRLKSGGADAGSSDSPIAAYAVKTSGGGNDFQLVGKTVQAAPYGIAVTKGDTQLSGALQQALDAIIKNGEYQKILQKWGAQDGAITSAVLNGGS
ncbi:ABC transporter substrate-binding protein [Streptomyces fuscigenes]|uniref:ABC transporter substrate-binding protein n=1 Tax=Streptomyces fuscigenes TaxID=1528880 RepID=UPI001F34FBCC|nr:ABC transporter substrate-binding protein [Streptomyces fuscigenes]MCF3962697.1 ABC transporter substrate-binding protein [Streptomyces fuscigenes]